MSTTGRLAKYAGAGVVAVVLALVAAVVLIIAVVFVVRAATSKSPTDKALSEVRRMITPGAQVRAESCRLASSDDDFDTFRCVVTTPKCRRSYLFMSSKVASFDNLSLADKSDAVLVHPCAIPSDRLLPGEQQS